MAVAKLVNITETPTIIINGNKLPSISVNEATFKKTVHEMIDEALKKAESENK